MSRFRSTGSAAAIALAVLALCGGCGSQEEETMNASPDAAEASVPCSWVAEGGLPVVDDLQARLDGYVPTELSPALDHLDETQVAVLGKLVQASKVVDRLFQVQATPCRDELEARLAELPAGTRESVRRYFDINYGPWDRRFHHEPFVGTWPHPEGANYYPRDLTADEKDHIADPAHGMDGLFTMIRRDADGALVAIPYSEFFRADLEAAAKLLREAADLTANESLATFLRSRAAAFLTDDYYESDMDWMDLDSTVEITIGPYETYEDGLFGYKAAFESFVTVTDPLESERLARFKDELPWLEANLPIPDAHKNPNRGSESPIRVVDEVYSAGDTRAGIQTIAFNLPNDERVREAKGSKKVLLRNVMKAKFDRILLPIAAAVVNPEQAKRCTAESFFLHTLWHEMSHGLGPGKLVLDGRETEVRLELKETYSTMEEAKADAMGEWAIFALTRAGRDYFPGAIFVEQTATYLAGLFRSVRFGIGEAHGQANAIQFNYLMEKGVLTRDGASGTFALEAAGFEKAIEELVHDITLIQAEGDYRASVDFIAKYGVMTPELAAGLEKLEGIPVDVEPVFTRYED